MNEPDWVKEAAENAPDGLNTEGVVPDKDEEMQREITHPGVYLEQFIDQADFSVRELADSINVSHTLIYDIIRGDTSIGSELAVKLGEVFEPDDDFWADRTKEHSLNKARNKLNGKLMEIKRQVGELTSNALTVDELDMNSNQVGDADGSTTVR